MNRVQKLFSYVLTSISSHLNKIEMANLIIVKFVIFSTNEGVAKEVDVSMKQLGGTRKIPLAAQRGDCLFTKKHLLGILHKCSRKNINYPSVAVWIVVLDGILIYPFRNKFFCNGSCNG